MSHYKPVGVVEKLIDSVDSLFFTNKGFAELTVVLNIWLMGFQRLLILAHVHSYNAMTVLIAFCFFFGLKLRSEILMANAS